jgi:hypothetical protein
MLTAAFKLPREPRTFDVFSLFEMNLYQKSMALCFEEKIVQCTPKSTRIACAEPGGKLTGAEDR